MSRSDFDAADETDKVPPAKSRFTPFPMIWNSKTSALWAKAWSRLSQDFMNYTGSELRQEEADAEYITEHATITRRR